MYRPCLPAFYELKASWPQFFYSALMVGIIGLKLFEVYCVRKCLSFILIFEWWFWLLGLFLPFLDFLCSQFINDITPLCLRMWSASICVSRRTSLCLFSIHDALLPLDFGEFWYKVSQTQVIFAYMFIHFILFLQFTVELVYIMLSTAIGYL